MRVDVTTLQSALAAYDIEELTHIGTRPFTQCFVGQYRHGPARVFIKVLHSDDAAIARNFARETGILEALGGQPGYPVLLASGRPPPLAFHACEYLAAQRLDALFGGPDRQDLGALLRDAGVLVRWIAKLHGRGYAHRDLSPDHVFLAGDRPLTVVDFGMAKPLAGLSSAEAQLYRGTDIQAFGMILWELICGRPLFPYRDPTLAVRVSEEIALIGDLPLPSELALLVTRCLSARSEFTPDGVGAFDGFETAADLDTALAAILPVEHAQ